MTDMNDLIKRLNEDTVLMTVKAKKWSGGKVDKTSAALLAQKHNGEKEGWTNANMKLLHPDYKKELTKLGNNVGRSMEKHGIPLNGGYLIRAIDYAKVRSETDAELAELAQFVDKLICDRQIIENWARTKLAEAYYEGVIPTDEELRQKFVQEVVVTPIGAPPAKLGDAANDVAESLTKQYNEALTVQMDMLKEMIADTKAIIAEVLAGDKQKFRTTRWEHIREQLDRVRNLNLNIEGLSEVAEAMDSMIESVKDIKSADVREDDRQAEKLTSTVNDMESLLAAF